MTEGPALHVEMITVVRARARRLAKLVHADGLVSAYDKAKTVDLIEVPVSDLDAIERLLLRLQTRTDCAIVRGAIIDPRRVIGVRRLCNMDRETGELPTLREQPRSWVALDIEKVSRPDDVDVTDLAECARIVLPRLPAPFHRAECIVQASSSHGIKADIRLRLWFWLSRATASAELKFWLRASPVDLSLFSAAQLTYTAAPLFDVGAIDPLPTRLARIAGACLVTVPSAERLRPPPRPDPGPAAPRPAAANAHAERLISRVLTRVRSAPEGERHPTLRAAARTIGGIMQQTGFSASQATAALLDAAKAAGAQDLDLAADTIRWGLDDGATKPLRLGDR